MTTRGGKSILFIALSLQNLQWFPVRTDEKVPQVDDFAHFFDSEQNNLYIFGGYLNGYKSNLLFKIDVATKCIKILSPDIPDHTVEPGLVPIQRTGARIVYHL